MCRMTMQSVPAAPFPPTRVSVEALQGGRGDMVLFQNVSFALHAGEALRVTGPNGSGKSTLLRAIAGLVEPLSGRVSFEQDGAPAERGVCLHHLGHLNAMKPQLTVAENLGFWTGLAGMPDPVAAWEEALARVGLARLRDLPFAYLSAGQKRRVAIARLIAVPRPVWLLDEPTAGLDRAACDMFESVLDAHLASGGIVVGATHVPLGQAAWREFSTVETAA
jgi:heme exporter protein A